MLYKYGGNALCTKRTIEPLLMDKIEAYTETVR